LVGLVVVELPLWLLAVSGCCRKAAAPLGGGVTRGGRGLLGLPGVRRPWGSHERRDRNWCGVAHEMLHDSSFLRFLIKPLHKRMHAGRPALTQVCVHARTNKHWHVRTHNQTLARTQAWAEHRHTEHRHASMGRAQRHVARSHPQFRRPSNKGGAGPLVLG